MAKQGPFKRQSQREIEDNTRSARLQYDPDTVNESMQKWNSYGEEKQNAIMAEGNAIYTDFVAAIEAGHSATGPEAREIVERWHAHLRYFYEPSLDIMRGLAETYRLSPDFADKFAAMHEALPDYLHEAIDDYVDELETIAIQQMLDEDDDALGSARGRLSS